MRALYLSHAFAKTNGLYTVVDSLEVFSRKGTLFPLPTATGKSFHQVLQKESQEKALVGWLWPLATSKRSPAGKQMDILAPVVIYEASLHVEDEIYYASIDLRLPQANPAFTDWMSENGDLTSAELAAFICPSKWNDIAIEQLESKLLETDALEVSLDNFHEYLSTKLPEKTKPGAKPQLLPIGGFSIVPKSKGSRGVLHELEEIVKASKTSYPIGALIQGDAQTVREIDKVTEPILVKANLSDNQKRIVYSSDVNTLTRVVGPPGTGKSFTTAAIASHAYARGQSVLVVSRNQEAVEVVADKIENELEMKNLVVRAARSTSRTQLRNRLKRILNKIGLSKLETKDYRLTKNILYRHLGRIKDFERAIAKRQTQLIRRSDRMFRARGRWYEGSLRKTYELVDTQRATLNELTALMLEEEKQFQYVIGESQHQHADARIAGLLNHNYTSLLAFYEGLTKREGVARTESFDEADFEVILGAFPIWTVTTADLHKVLPLQTNLFDLVIIDEASQTDIASSIPALYRANRAVIIGDPFQLRHISFVSGDQQTTLIQRFNLNLLPASPLNYREVSVLDLAEMRTQSGHQVHMLDEHFRSQPEIIQFSNATYYGNSLKIMTRGFEHPSKPPLRAISTNGKQDKTGVNREEGRVLLKELRDLIRAMRLRDSTKSIGILSPFSAQVKYLEKEVENLLDADDMHDCKIFVGTPFNFQGEERDIMLLSFALSDESHAAAFRYLERPGVFNVAITRGRDIQKVFYSFDPEGKYESNIAAKYLREIGQPTETVSFADIPSSSSFLEDLRLQLEATLGLQFEQDVVIAGQRLDLLLTYQDKRVALDLVGLPGPRGEALPIHAVRSLARIEIELIYIDAFKGIENCMTLLNELFSIPS